MDWGVLRGGCFGFTGTRTRITSCQREQLMGFLSVQGATRGLRMHYGDCPTGADYEMYCLCKAVGVYVVSHPSNLNPGRKVFFGDEVRGMKPPLVRNCDVVDESDFLIAAPKEDREVLRSGTWATVRYARKLGTTVALVLPDGRVDIQSPGW